VVPAVEKFEKDRRLGGTCVRGAACSTAPVAPIEGVWRRRLPTAAEFARRSISLSAATWRRALLFRGAGHVLFSEDAFELAAVRALRELLDNPDRNDWDELIAANRALIEAIATCRPMTRRNARIVSEYLREAGWQEHAIGSATAQAGAQAGWRRANGVAQRRSPTRAGE
jgi:hypothetical protein